MIPITCCQRSYHRDSLEQYQFFPHWGRSTQRISGWSSGCLCGSVTLTGVEERADRHHVFLLAQDLLIKFILAGGHSHMTGLGPSIP